MCAHVFMLSSEQGSARTLYKAQPCWLSAALGTVLRIYRYGFPRSLSNHSTVIHDHVDTPRATILELDLTLSGERKRILPQIYRIYVDFLTL